MTADVEPRTYTAPLSCPDCREETTHTVVVWPFGSATSECHECGLICDLGVIA